MHVFSRPQVDPVAVEAALRDAGVRFGREERVERAWLDSFDLRLTAAGMRLETANGRSSAITTLFQAEHPPAFVSGADAPRFATDFAAGPFRERLARAAGVRAFLPVATITATARAGEWHNADDKVVARVTLWDHAMLTTGAALGWGVEVDELVGYDAPTRKLTRRLHDLGLRAVEGDLFDLAVAENLVKLDNHTPRTLTRFDTRERALPGYRRVLTRLFETIELNWDGAAHDVDPEFLHDLRVALRRTRSVLASAKGVIDEGERDHFLAEFHFLASTTSEPRDLDVAALDWPATVRAVAGIDVSDLAPVEDALAARRAAAHARFAKDLASKRTTQLVQDWEHWLTAEPASEPVRAGLPLRSVVSRALQRLRSRLRDDEHDFTPEGRHTTRKDAKQLRYMVECFGGVYDTERRKAFVKQLSAFQDRLGRAQDARVQAGLLRDLVRGGHFSPDTLLAAGRLTEAIEARARVAKRKDLRLFTKKVDRSFHDLIESRR